MEGRFFAKRKLNADYYDGVTNYFVAESEEEKTARLKKWEEWLEHQELGLRGRKRQGKAWSTYGKLNFYLLF